MNHWQAKAVTTQQRRAAFFPVDTAMFHRAHQHSVIQTPLSGTCFALNAKCVWLFAGLWLLAFALPSHCC